MSSARIINKSAFGLSSKSSSGMPGDAQASAHYHFMPFETNNKFGAWKLEMYINKERGRSWHGIS